MRRLAAVVALTLLATNGCASSPLRALVREDLLAAQQNFDGARMVTESQCVQAVLDRMAADDAADFQVRGVLSAGSVPYILYARYLGSAQQPISEQCYAVIGKITTAVGKRGVGVFVP